MDRVRLGRALGFGARQAVKTLVTAVDAATAESPSSKTAVPRASAPRPAAQRARPYAKTEPAAAKAGQAAGRTASQARLTKQGVGRGAKKFGEAVWNPFVRLSGVLWLEVTGVFFGILALFAGEGVWKAREEWHAGPRQHLFGAAVMLVLFGYFCVSSFVRAYRRQRGR